MKLHRMEKSIRQHKILPMPLIRTSLSLCSPLWLRNAIATFGSKWVHGIRYSKCLHARGICRLVRQFAGEWKVGHGRLVTAGTVSLCNNYVCN